jgi:hypothetical protein
MPGKDPNSNLTFKQCSPIELAEGRPQNLSWAFVNILAPKDKIGGAGGAEKLIAPFLTFSPTEGGTWGEEEN